MFSDVCVKWNETDFFKDVFFCSPIDITALVNIVWLPLISIRKTMETMLLIHTTSIRSLT